MRILKTKVFDRWAAKEGISDETLNLAVNEIELGLFEADLGGHILKKRIASSGRGKRGGSRVILAYRINDNAFFIHGFAKNTKANISIEELRALKLLAKELLSFTDKSLNQAIEGGALIEVPRHD